MKKYIIFSVIATLFFAACKEEKKKVDLKGGNTEEVVSDPLAQHDLKLYKQAMRRGDFITAVYSLNSLIERDSALINYKDTLAVLYLQTRQLEPCLAVTDELLQLRPKDTALLKRYATAAQAGGDISLAVNKLKTLWEVTNDIEYKYYYGVALLNGGNPAEGERIIDEVISDPSAKSRRIPYYNENGSDTPITLEVAGHLMKGMFYGQMRMKDKAVAQFRKVLDINPNFEPAAEAILQLQYNKK